MTMMWRRVALVVLLIAVEVLVCTFAFTTASSKTISRTIFRYRYLDDDNDAFFSDTNSWLSDNSESSGGDWARTLKSMEDGSLWSSFESSDDETSEIAETEKESDVEVDGGEVAFLSTLAAISANEVNFMIKENERADKARQMQEHGFSADSISSALGVATDESSEVDSSNNEALEAFKDATAKTGFGLMVDDDIDLELVESHTMVDWCDETDKPVRNSFVYVDEVTCVGCTLCASFAQSTFFMEEEQGRARVFGQWGDDDDIIEQAIDICPVECIHSVSYEELQRLEMDRRGQHINPASRLVGGAATPKFDGGMAYTTEQNISLELDKDFELKELKRKENMARNIMKIKMESLSLRVEL